MPERERSWVSEMRPPSSTDWPLATAIELLTLRCDMVGVSVLAFPLSTILLISCSMLSRTLPLTLTLGATRRMTPVLR